MIYYNDIGCLFRCAAERSGTCVAGHKNHIQSASYEERSLNCNESWRPCDDKDRRIGNGRNKKISEACVRRKW